MTTLLDDAVHASAVGGRFRTSNRVERLIDLIAACLVLSICLPLRLVVLVAVWVTSRGLRPFGKRMWACAGAFFKMLNADARGSNSFRARQWKVELGRLAGRTGLAITVCQYPAGTSKWNKREYHLLTAITTNWRGRPPREPRRRRPPDRRHHQPQAPRDARRAGRGRLPDRGDGQQGTAGPCPDRAPHMARRAQLHDRPRSHR